VVARCVDCRGGGLRWFLRVRVHLCRHLWVCRTVLSARLHHSAAELRIVFSPLHSGRHGSMEMHRVTAVRRAKRSLNANDWLVAHSTV